MTDGTPPGRRGLAAIDRHVDRADGGPEAGRYHPRPSNRFFGPGPVEAVSLHELSGPHHWHLVTYGLSELDAKESLDRYRSGWGFELTFRVAEGEDRPLWAVDFLASMAAYVRSSQHPFAAGHNVDLRGPIRPGADSHITAAMIVEDPVLGSIDGPFGSVQFLQIVGLTADELELCRAWSTEGVQELLAREDPLLVTRLERASLAADPRFTDEIARRISEEGSSLHELRVASLRVGRRLGRGTFVQLGAGAASALGSALRRELVAEGATFSVVGDDFDLRFVVEAEPGWSWQPSGLEIAVPLEHVEAWALLFDGHTGWSRLAEWPGLQLRVVK